MKQKLLWSTLIFATLLAAATLRLPRLVERPMHADESVQAAIFEKLWIGGEYMYNPDEFHGPTLPYATLLSVGLGNADSFAETTEATYRLVPAVFSLGIVLLMFCLADALGRPAVFAAGLLAALSPAMVYYGRYFIHETPLAFFTLAAIVCGWRYFRSGHLAWALAAGSAVGFMQATKETAVLSYIAAIGALALTSIYDRLTPRPTAPARPVIAWWHLAVAAAAALAVAVVLFTSFLTNLRGALDAVLTYLPWLNRAGGASPHINPWHFFFHRLGWWQVDDGSVWSEAVILVLAAVGVAAAMCPRGRFLGSADRSFARWLAFYTVLLTAAYTVIPYKTPWCMLQFLLGMLLLAGLGADVLFRVAGQAGAAIGQLLVRGADQRSAATLPAVARILAQSVVVLVLLAGAGQLSRQTCRACFQMPADPANPYVFAHTSPGAVELHETLEAFAVAHAEGHAMPVLVIWRDHYLWPLPWYLRRFEHVELRTTMPDDPAAAAVILCSPEFDKPLSAAIEEQTHLMPGYFELRPQVLGMHFVREDVWLAYLEAQDRL